MFVDRELAVRLETAEAELTRQYVEAYSALYPDVGAGSAHVCGGRVSFAGKDSPLSRADAIGLREAVTASVLDFIEEFLTVRGAPPTLLTCPFTHRSLFSIVGERGYEVDHFLNLFVLPLRREGDDQAQLTGSGLSSSPFGQGTGCSSTGLRNGEVSLEVLRVDDCGAAKDRWSLIAGLGFASMDAGSPPYMDIYRGISHASGTVSFLATIDGDPAGAGALKVAGNTAFLSTASTLPRFRRQGVQMALMKARLAEAKRQGCDLAVVMTSPGADSERNVGRAGFRLAYTRLRLVKR